MGAKAENILARLVIAAQKKGGQAFCWPAFLCPVPWLLYRKMYGVAIALLLAPLTLKVLLPGFISPLKVTLLSIGLGVCGLRLYLNHAARLIALIREDSDTESEARERIARAGGVSVAGAWIGVAVSVAFGLFYAAPPPGAVG